MARLQNDGKTANDSRPARFLKSRLRLLIAGVVAVALAAVWYVTWPSPLTDAETKLVGIWTFPTPPNPPANAIKQIFEMRSDHTLVVYKQPFATGVTSVSGNGTWRLEDGMLVWEAQARIAWTTVARWAQGARWPSVNVDRMPYLGREGEDFLVEAIGGSAARFVPLPKDQL